MNATKVESPIITVRRSAMDYLARREHSFHELTQKLIEKYPDFDQDQLILPALNALRKENLQSDRRFVESYIRYRRQRGFGPVKIQSELFQKGLDAGLVRDEVYAKDNDWTFSCKAAFEKKFLKAARMTTSVNNCSEQSNKLKLKQQRFLMQRGFALEDINSTLKSSRA